MVVTDKHYEENGIKYDRITSIIDKTIGGGGDEAMVCETAKYASRLYAKSVDGEVLEKPVRIWDGNKFTDGFESVSPAEVLSDYRRIQGESFRVRQGWLDRGTVGNLLFDAFANGLEPTALNAMSFIDEELAGCKEFKGETPIPYQCDREDLMNRAVWLARFFREVKPVITHTQVFCKCDKLQIAGTADAVGAIDVLPGIIELKFGTEQFSHQVQVSSYKHLRVGRKKFGCFLLYIGSDGYRLVQLTNKQINEGWQVMNRILPAYRIKTERRNWTTYRQNSENKLTRKVS